MTASSAPVRIRAEAGPEALATTVSGPWQKITESVIPLAPTPLSSQPSAYVRRSWADRRHGLADSVSIAAAVADGRLLIRLRWRTGSPRLTATDINEYPDACAVLFPLDGKEADLTTMGSDEHPVCGWHWRAGSAEAFIITARGLGTVERVPKHDLEAIGEWNNGEWQVLFNGALGGETPPLAPGGVIPIGAAVWTGAAEERAGLKAHTPAWHSLALGAEGDR